MDGSCSKTQSLPLLNNLLKIMILLLIMAPIALATRQTLISGEITCPKLSCDKNLTQKIEEQYIQNGEKKLCLSYSSESPITNLHSYKCDDNEICSFTESGFASLKAATQAVKGGTDSSLSAIYSRNTKAYCINTQTLNQVPGLPCSQDGHCKSQNCTEGRCAGTPIGSNCVTTSECEPGAYCKREASFPFNSLCSSSQRLNQTCTTTTECRIGMVCGYPSAADIIVGQATCLEQYALAKDTTIGFYSYYDRDWENMIENGKLCSSGLAVRKSTPLNEGTCIEISKIESDQGSDISSPYACTAANPVNTCKYYYSTTEFMEKGCECSIDGSIGYCPLNPTMLKSSIEMLKLMVNLTTDFKCNIEASLDFPTLTRCIDVEDTTKKMATSYRFNATYWPIVQSNEQYECMEQIHPEAFPSVKKLNASRGLFIGLLSLLITLL